LSCCGRVLIFFFSSRRRHTRFDCDWSSDVCSSDLDALYASCALPLYFPPAVIDGRRLADGGLRAVLALEVARRIPADLVVAVHVGPGFDEPPPPPSTPLRRLLPPPLIRAHGEAIRIMMAAQTEVAIAAWPPDAARLVV